jgi:anti-anti-sigma factor
MMTNRLEARVRHLPGVAIIDLKGEINASDEEALDRAYAEAESGGPEAILLNFSGVRYMNSTGIALIVALLSRARSAGRRVLACGLEPHYLEVFAVTRLTDLLSVFPDEATALAAQSPA